METTILLFAEGESMLPVHRIKWFAALVLTAVLLVHPAMLCRAETASSASASAAAPASVVSSEQTTEKNTTVYDWDKAKNYSNLKERNLIIFVVLSGAFFILLGLAKKIKDGKKHPDEAPYSFGDDEELILKRKKYLKAAEKIRTITFFLFIIGSCFYFSAVMKADTLFDTRKDNVKLVINLITLLYPGLFHFVRKEKTKLLLNIIGILLFTGMGVYFMYHFFVGI